MKITQLSNDDVKERIMQGDIENIRILLPNMIKIHFIKELQLKKVIEYINDDSVAFLEVNRGE